MEESGEWEALHSLERPRAAPALSSALQPAPADARINVREWHIKHSIARNDLRARGEPSTEGAQAPEEGRRGKKSYIIGTS